MSINDVIHELQRLCFLTLICEWSKRINKCINSEKHTSQYVAFNDTRNCAHHRNVGLVTKLLCLVMMVLYKCLNTLFTLNVFSAQNVW